ncbi:bifunctional anthranilate synthase component I family protein/aminotransferase class IV [Svornostia abyssi]|uniref:Bifunctional anthranilate synthase component I family protein/aminotransferase class IV n=1 Tax=Svornostia abyssi TaxID=2898438 RepID=A0ABY5PBM9_9ACTN|nr:bifunctional anthranilate synthase component I family protein/aminotransferase class IV [Parviterribacteraceae bacterium J379]
MPFDRHLLAEGVTLAAVARAVAPDDRPFVLTGRWADGSTIAGSAPMRDLAPGEDPFAALDDLPTSRATATFGGGWVGLLGFALGARVEDLPPSPPARGATSPEHRLAFYDHVVRLDADGRCWLESLGIPGREDPVAARAALLRDRLRAPAPTAGWHAGPMDVLAPGGAGHEEAVTAVIERIHAGEIFQANLCLRLTGRFGGSALEAWLALMGRAPAAYGAYIGWDGGAVLSASPELFLRRVGREVSSLPMKGTRPRVAGEDETAARELARAPKDAAENVMIVDLMRNDLGRVCAYGSIEVEPPEVEAHPGVWQLVRRVRGTLRDEVGDAELVRACFPPGSVVGAPKVQALKVIAAEEATARGAHCGAIGYASPHAGLELSVAIRTLEVAGDEIALGVGGGIVADSVAADEHRECLVKAAPVLAGLGLELPGRVPTSRAASPPALLTTTVTRPDPARGIFETVLVAGGAPVALDAHLARMRRSALALRGTAPDLAVAADEVHALAREGAAAARIIAVPDPAGGWTVTVMARPAPAPLTGPVELVPVLLPGGLGEHKWADREALNGPRRGASWLLCDRGGEVLEAAWANVWLREGDTVVTPPVDGRLLPGTRRAAILADPASAGALRAAVERVDLDRLRRADAVLLSSALRIVPAAVALPAGSRRGAVSSRH